MTEGNMRGPIPEQNTEFIRKLKEIGTDLWGSLPGKYEKKGTVCEKNTIIPVKLLFRISDEVVDWTDALVYDRSQDGLTSSERWAFYHSRAENVLQGNLQTYTEVLTKLNPLGDLVSYTNDLKIRTPDPERLEVIFECRKELMEPDPELYLSALSLRMARDLFAVLPVSEVGIEARQNGECCFEVTLLRSQLRQLQFMFLDPVSFVQNCRDNE